MSPASQHQATSVNSLLARLLVLDPGRERMELTPEQRPTPERPMESHGTIAPERLWSTAQLAAYLGVPVKTIHQWRYMQKGPRGFRVGRHLRFRPADVRAWEDEQLDEASA